MTWRHEPIFSMDSYIIDAQLVKCEVLKVCGKWAALMHYGRMTTDFMEYRRFPTAEDAMSAVEERLASMAQDLLSDALGIRRISEGKCS